MKIKKRGQVWIETVIYTLIAFVMIGAVLTFAKPKIEEIQDKAILDKTLELFDGINSAIFVVAAGGQGNQRKITIGLKKGELTIDGFNDEIIFNMQSRHEYSEPGKEIAVGDLDVNTTKKGKYNDVKLTNDYNGDYNIKYDGVDNSKTLTKTATLYTVLVSNQGRDKVSPTTSELCEGVGDAKEGCINPDYINLGYEPSCVEVEEEVFECYYISPKLTINFEVIN